MKSRTRAINSVITISGTGFAASGMAMSPDGSRLYVAGPPPGGHAATGSTRPFRSMFTGYVLRAAAFAALLAFAAIPAEAQPQYTVCFKGFLCVVDANGTKIGSLMQSNAYSVMREFKGVLYQFPIWVTSIPEGEVSPLYTNTNCTGTAYFALATPMPVANVDTRSRIWGPVPPYSTQTIAAEKLSSGECVPLTGRGGPYTEQIMVGVAKVLSARALANLKPPFSAVELGSAP